MRGGRDWPPLPPRLKPILDAEYPRYSAAEMARRRAAVEAALAEAECDHLATPKCHRPFRPGLYSKRKLTAGTGFCFSDHCAVVIGLRTLRGVDEGFGLRVV